MTVVIIAVLAALVVFANIWLAWQLEKRWS